MPISLQLILGLHNSLDVKETGLAWLDKVIRAEYQQPPRRTLKINEVSPERVRYNLYFLDKPTVTLDIYKKIEKYGHQLPALKVDGYSYPHGPFTTRYTNILFLDIQQNRDSLSLHAGQVINTISRACADYPEVMLTGFVKEVDIGNLPLEEWENIFALGVERKEPYASIYRKLKTPIKRAKPQSEEPPTWKPGLETTDQYKAVVKARQLVKETRISYTEAIRKSGWPTYDKIKDRATKDNCVRRAKQIGDITN